VFNTVVRWHKLGEVANEYTSEKFVPFAIFVPKMSTIGRNLTKIWQKISLYSFFETRCICMYDPTSYWMLWSSKEIGLVYAYNNFQLRAYSSLQASFELLLKRQSAYPCAQLLYSVRNFPFKMHYGGEKLGNIWERKVRFYPLINSIFLFGFQTIRCKVSSKSSENRDRI